MNQMGLPCQLAHRFQRPTSEEEETLVAAWLKLACLVKGRATLGEIFLVVNKIHLKAGRGQRTNLNNQLVVAIVYNEIHSREANNFMKLVFALVDVAEARHEDAYFPTQFLGKLREVTIHQCCIRLIRKRRNALVDI